MMDNLFNLSGKIALVMGGSGNLGTAEVDALAAYGAKVISAHRTIPSKTRENVTHLSADFSKEEEFLSVFETVKKEWGKIDILVNNAAYGGGSGGKGLSLEMEHFDNESWNQGIDGNLGLCFKSIRAAIPLMKEKGGSIINIASMYGVVSPDPSIYGDSGNNSPVTYGVSKAGVLQLTRYAAAHLAKYNIRVNAITPGPFPNEKTLSNKEFSQKLADKTMLKRVGKSEEICGATILLASDASTFMTGSNITIDGGWTAW
ncbi:MAG: SDR family oxidoreductase [Ruminococcaceae bacterium]|nr:SDR family oxidoreductase [Oscillospiraceae bacterium]